MNPKLSWMNKWKNKDYKQGEKFIGSSTVFVMFTDLWHLCHIFNDCIIYIINNLFI